MTNSSVNFLDRAIGFLSPGWQLKRMQHRSAVKILASYYEAGEVSRRTQEWKRPSGDANAPTGVTLARLRNSARDLIRNNGYAESAIRTIQDDVVGWGMKPTAKHQRWKEWSYSTQIDADGQCDLPGLQELIMRTVVESGECLVRRRIRRLSDGLAIPMQIQVLEPDFIDTSKHKALEGGRRIVRGIEFDALGRRVAYWLYREHPGSTTLSYSLSLTESKRVPASEVLHVYKVKRPGQVRGASWFAPCLIRFKDFDEFADATLMKQKIAACLSVITSDVDGSSTRFGSEDPNNTLHDMIEPGLIANIPPGRSIDVVNPPTVREYPDYVKTTLQEIASGLGVTPEDLTGDYSNLNFSAARMSRLRHWARVQGWRWRMMVPQFLDPLWRWTMEICSLAGLPVVENEEWTGPPLPMIEPDKEGQAIVKAVRGGILTPSEALRERGFDPETFWEEYESDFEDLDRRGIVLDSDARKMTQQGIAQFSAPYLSEPPDGPPEPEAGSSESSDGGNNGNGVRPDEEDEDDIEDVVGLMSITAAARQLNINPATVRSWVQKGAIPHWKVGPSGAIRVRVSDLLVNSTQN